MDEPNYLIIFFGIIVFYFFKLKKLKKYMSAPNVLLYSTLKLIVLVVMTMACMLFTHNIIDANNKIVLGFGGVAFIITLVVITIYEDKKIGVIDDIIQKAKDDFYK